MIKSLRAKLLLSFMIVTVSLSAVSIFGYNKYAEQGQRIKHLANTDLAQMEIIFKLNNLFREKVNFTKDGILDVSSLNRKRLEKSQKKIFDLLAKAEQMIQEDKRSEKSQIGQYIKNLSSLHKKYDTNLEQFIKAKTAGDAVLSEELLKENEAIAGQITITTDSWTFEIAKEADQKLREAQHDSNSTLFLTIMFIIFSVLVATIIAIYLGIKITRPVKLLAESAYNISEGNLTIDLPVVRAKDELGTLSESFIKLKSNLTTIIKEISSMSEEVSTNSDKLYENTVEVSNGGQLMSSSINQVVEGIQKQSSIVEEAVLVIREFDTAIEQIATNAFDQTQQINDTTLAVTQMAQTINEMAKNAQEVRQAAEHTFLFAQKGGTAVNNSIKGMESVKTNVLNTADRIHILGEQSTKIGAIIQVIEDIADQTNLLALNAAIEAARAGDRGKGFAVVADEVRILAEKSRKATKEITRLIASIQLETAKVIDSVEDGTREVEKGSALAQDAGAALEDIINTMQVTLQQVENISQSTVEIAENSDSVVRVIQSLAVISEENAATTEQMTAGSQQVVDIIKEISSLSRTGNDLAEKASSSVNEMKQSVYDINNSANDLSNMANRLRRMVNRFKL